MLMAAELPITLDYPWSASVGLFAVAAIGILLVATRVVRIGDHWAKPASVGVLAVMALWSALHFATWQARIDTQGVAVSAPFDPLRRQGAVAWRDAASVSIGGRLSLYRLRVTSRTGTTAEITLAELPAIEVAPLAQAVATYTAHVEGRQRSRDYLILAHRAARSVRGITTLRLHTPAQQVAQAKPPQAVR
jgi:hypothetical protein